MAILVDKGSPRPLYKRVCKTIIRYLKHTAGLIQPISLRIKFLLPFRLVQGFTDTTEAIGHSA